MRTSLLFSLAVLTLSVACSGGNDHQSGSDAALPDAATADGQAQTDASAPPDGAVSPDGGAGGQWVTVYYPTWREQALGTTYLGHWMGLPPTEVDWTGLTHVVHFGNGNVTSTPPYWLPTVAPDGTAPGEGREWQYGGCTGTSCIDYQKQLIDTVHQHGIKVVISIQAVDPTNFIVAVASPSSTQQFVDAIMAYVKDHGYDGVELDLEHWSGTEPSWPNVNQFVKTMRQGLDTMSPHGLFLMSPGEFDFDNYDPAQDGMVDQYNLQTYAMSIVWNGCISANGAWFMNALYANVDNPPGSYYWGTGAACFEGRGVDGTGSVHKFGIDGWIASGHDPKKLGVGTSLAGELFRGTDTLYAAYDPGPGYVAYPEMLRLLTVGGVETWDDARKVHTISGTATQTIGNNWYGENGVTAGQKFFATFESPESLQAKAAWVKNRAIGGLMLYEIGLDLDATQPFGQRNPLVKAATTAMSQ